jgi:hypothetical protein
MLRSIKDRSMDQRQRIAAIFEREIAQAEDDMEPYVEWLKSLRDEVIATLEYV